MKYCPKCQETKPTGEFSKNRSMRDGLQGWCKLCAAEKAKVYRKANRASLTQKNREWRAANPDKVAAYYEANKELINHRSREHYAANKERYRENRHRWMESNRERFTEYRNEWSRINGSGHRARCKRFGVPYTPISKTAIFVRDNWVCGLCGDAVDRTIPWPDPMSPTLDHIVPLSHPESPGHTDTNVHLAHFFCNLIKRASHG